MKLGSLFDGIGGFPLSGVRHGIEPVWASEIEPWPIKVTQHHFPDMKHLGDLTQISGAEIEPVDIITFGSPCQDLSVAGKREGLEGARSGLFMDAVRIIREMRTATRGQCPRFAVWENVPGAYSSNGGQDFRAVLEEIAEAKIPMPTSGKWAEAGMVRTERVDVAWRTLDAQYWGVPQRRKRIFLVADFAGGSAGEILFKSEGLSGYSKESFRSWQGTANCFENGIRETGTSSMILNDQGGNRMDITEDVTCTLRAEAHHPPCVMDADVFDNHGRDTRFTGPIDVAPTISATYGTGGNNQPFVVNVNNYAVRRLTPLECLRLQGFPDNWLDIEGMSDTAKYKAIGNSVAVPCVEFVMAGLRRVVDA